MKLLFIDSGNDTSSKTTTSSSPAPPGKTMTKTLKTFYHLNIS